jgi:hypothetical protein
MALGVGSAVAALGKMREFVLSSMRAYQEAELAERKWTESLNFFQKGLQELDDPLDQHVRRAPKYPDIPPRRQPRPMPA